MQEWDFFPFFFYFFTAKLWDLWCALSMESDREERRPSRFAYGRSWAWIYIYRVGTDSHRGLGVTRNGISDVSRQSEREFNSWSVSFKVLQRYMASLCVYKYAGSVCVFILWFSFWFLYFFFVFSSAIFPQEEKCGEEDDVATSYGVVEGGQTVRKTWCRNLTIAGDEATTGKLLGSIEMAMITAVKGEIFRWWWWYITVRGVDL